MTLEKQMQDVQQPQLQSISSRLEKEAAMFSELTYCLQRKLHNILNKESPEKASPPALERVVNDFVSATQQSIDSISKSNRSLEAILKHLDEII